MIGNNADREKKTRTLNIYPELKTPSKGQSLGTCGCLIWLLLQ